MMVYRAIRCPSKELLGYARREGPQAMAQLAQGS
jgi:hypothetical protein